LHKIIKDNRSCDSTVAIPPLNRNW